MCEKKKKETNEECDKKVYQKYISIFLYIRINPITTFIKKYTPE